MKRADGTLRRLAGALGPALLLALFTIGCGDDSSDSRVPDAAVGDAAPADAARPIDAPPADADPNAPDAALEDCGGFVPKECARGETFCDYPQNDCGGGDATGVCRPRPAFCQPQEEPVCGCDGQNYPNECEAHAAGTDIAQTGACPT